MLVEFTKMHGLGNDFMVVESLSRPLNLTTEKIKGWADRHLGIGFDQLLMIEPPKQPNVDFTYRIFNADGGEVSQCGNGARCIAKYIRDKKLSPKSNLTVETKSGLLHLELLEREIEVNMGTPSFEPSNIPFLPAKARRTDHKTSQYALDIAGQVIEFIPLSIGNPHAVIRVDNLSEAPLETLGPLIESHPAFPDGINVGFAEIPNPNIINLRVFERGAGETQACGSGACAAMAACFKQGWVNENVLINLTGGPLNISWKGDNQPLYMKGTANHVYEGRIEA